MDRRQKKTREAVFNAFERLLERRNYDSITVQEIIDEADIGRSTFYAHFETKDALLQAMCTDIFDHVFSPDLTKEATHDFSASSPGLEPRLTHILYHLQEKRPMLQGLLTEAAGGHFMKYFRLYLSEMFTGYLSMGSDTSDGAAFNDAPVSCPKDFLLHHAVTAFAETVRWWLCGESCNAAYSPEEVAEFYLSVMPG
ncbi:MAG: TetR/AcrR family transcriptional regulator [Firmicutes bacterium]|nr:TetR/AcrR family transcriptional regulator [Bacillota bacterium]